MREGRWGDLRRGGGGRGEGEYIQTRSRLSCFCVFVGAVYMHIARCRLFMD